MVLVSNATKIVNFASMRSILVIRLSSLGDIILATPIVRRLQRSYPSARIDVAVSERFAGVWNNNPRVHSVWRVPEAVSIEESDTWKLEAIESLATVSEGKYDLVVDLQNSMKSRALRKGLGREYACAPKHRLEKLALVWLKKRPSRITPIVERYEKPLSHLPMAQDTDPCELWLPEESAQGWYPDQRPRASGELRIALAPGAYHATKRWPAARFAALARMLHEECCAAVVLVGGPGDSELCTAVAIAAGVPVERADGAKTVEETVRVLDRCSVLVSNDSAVMHMAAARRVPVVAIFGSTVRELGFAPYAAPHIVVEADVSCRPCSHIGRATCPRSHFSCMMNIEPSDVLKAAQRFINP